MIKDVIVVNKEYVNAKGEKKIDRQFFIVLTNDKRIRISPYRCVVKGREWNTFSDLLVIATRYEE